MREFLIRLGLCFGGGMALAAAIGLLFLEDSVSNQACVITTIWLIVQSAAGAAYILMEREDA